MADSMKTDTLSKASAPSSLARQRLRFQNSQRVQLWTAMAAGATLILLTGLGTATAVICGLLAQPILALATRALHTKDLGLDLTNIGTWRSGGITLLALWASAFGIVVVLLAWPLLALLRHHSLWAAVGLSAITGACVIGLWRIWPLWHAAETGTERLSTQWRALSDTDTSSWQGLFAASLIAVVVGTLLLLAWPGVLSVGMRWWLAASCGVIWPAIHWRLQQLPAAARHLPVYDLTFDYGDQPDSASPALPQFEGDPNVNLYEAARSGRVDRAMALLDFGADPLAMPTMEDRDQRTLPMLAAVLPDLRLLRALIARGVDLNAARAGMTPLLAATRDSWHGRPDAVMTLLANGADPRIADAEGNTPLHHAARSSDPGVAALLRDAAAEIDVLNNENVTPLGIACLAGNWRLARFLLERGAKPEPDGATPALLTAAGGDDDDSAGVQLLLKHKASVDARDRNGRSALHEAAYAGHPDIITALLAAGADAHARDALDRTPLLEAARGGKLGAFEALMTTKTDIHVVDRDGQNALSLVCQADAPSPALIRRLLELGIDTELADSEGKRAIDHAAAAGRWSLVSLLDSDYVLPSAVANADEAPAQVPDRAPLSLLRDGLRAGHYESMHDLLQLVSADELGSLLIDAEVPLSEMRIEWLLAHGANAEHRIAHADTPLFALLSQGAAAATCIQAMLHRAVSPAGRGGLARFLAACVESDQAGRHLEMCALDLLERGADPFAASLTGDPPLALAVRLGWMRVIERLLVHGIHLDARDSHGVTALHLAAALGRDTALKMLIAHGASPDVRAADGQTALGVALSGGRRDLADWLDWRGWPLPKRALQATDLPAAAIVGDADAVRRLLDLGMPVDTADAQGCTALLRAAGGGHRATVDLLLARGADPKRAARTGATPLSAAVSMRHGEIVDQLLSAGATLEQRLPGNVTVLMLSAALGLPDISARLLTAGANVQATDAQGLTPLHCAALYGFTGCERPRLLALLDTLLLAGAEPDAAAHTGVTPLLLLLGARAEPGTACDEGVLLAAIEQLIDEGVSLDTQDPRGFGPLHLSALHGLLRTTQYLLRAGANPDLRDTLNRTPKEIAVMRGFVDVAAEFAPQQAGVSMARFLREPN